MANPARQHDDPQDPRLVNDPINPVPPLGPDPLSVEPRTAADEPRVDNTTPVRSDRGMGTSVLIAAVVLVLAVVAYFVFGPSGTETPPEQPAATEPAAPAPGTGTPAAPAPSGTAPATPTEPAPAQPAQPAPAQ